MSTIEQLETCRTLLWEIREILKVREGDSVTEHAEKIMSQLPPPNCKYIIASQEFIDMVKDNPNGPLVLWIEAKDGNMLTLQAVHWDPK